ncbi:hypothetical protein KA977_13780 [Candidatus Dependentiae bacterium]|nr:hypothetical protein [Candidatus Dependentiae bacterium]
MCKISKNLKKIEDLKNRVLCLETELEEFENADVLVKDNAEKIVELQKILIEQLEGKIDFLNEKIEKLRQTKKSTEELVKQREIICELTGLLDALNKNLKIKEVYEKIVYDINGNKNVCGDYRKNEVDEQKYSEEEDVDRAIRRLEENAIEEAENVLKEVKVELTENITSIEENAEKINEQFENAYIELNNLKKDTSNAGLGKIINVEELFDNDLNEKEIEEIERNSDIKENDKIESILSEVDKIGIEIEKKFFMHDDLENLNKNEIYENKDSVKDNNVIDGVDISGDSLTDLNNMIGSSKDKENVSVVKNNEMIENSNDFNAELEELEKEIESIDMKNIESDVDIKMISEKKEDIDKIIENELNDLKNIENEKLFENVDDDNLLNDINIK